MKITFNIEYRTEPGEELVLNIRKESQANAKKRTASYRMHTDDGHTWTCNLRLDKRAGTYIDYFYTVVRGEDSVTRCEWRVEPHRLEINATGADQFTVNDIWIGTPEDTYLYSSAFTDCIRQRTPVKAPLSGYPVTVRVKVRAPQLGHSQSLRLVGSDVALGAWAVGKGMKMYEHTYNEWVADIDASRLTDNRLEYKFVAIDSEDPQKVMWEEGYNREITLPVMRNGSVAVYEQQMAFFQICDTKFAGIQVPLFSLRSDTSFGVGDFGDLKKFIDWMHLTGQRILQLLPTNDTTSTRTKSDSYPYNSVSIFALHPQYADLNALPPLKDEKKRKQFQKLQQELNRLPYADYEKVNNAKREYLAELFRQDGNTVMASEEFKTFFAEAEQWLVPYAQYCSLRDRYGIPDPAKWPEKNRKFNERDRKALTTPTTEDYREAAIHYYTQFILHRQMSEAHDYARRKGIILKGDIPIGVSRYGCDAWQTPRYFNMNGQAGAPPDAFSTNGQNWGFPTYNWPEMQKDGCRWWSARFGNMAKYFDAYRIDHVLGFFRIWEIPSHAVHGLLGQFSPALGLSREEIEAAGLKFDEELFTQPYITDQVLQDFFAYRATMVRDMYLEPLGDGRYRMKPEYDTQRKVEAAFKGKTDSEYTAVRDGLYRLISNVLFVRDHRDSERYHPRITVQYDPVYAQLSDSDKETFNRLYDEYFYRRNNQFWYREAMGKLPSVTEATRMLVCAEDLGMVPECVDRVMRNLRILSLEMQTMPKEPGVRFGNLQRNPYRSVCAFSSHDTPTMRQWWDEDAERAQDYFNTMLHRYGPAPHPMPGSVAREVIRRHLECPSMICIVPLQDWFATDEKLRLADDSAERINVPSNPHNYWCYRMHVSIESLIKNDEFNQSIKKLIADSGR